jgi:hypothetical protein
MAEKTDKNVVVAVYKDHASAEAAVKELQKAGFDMKKLSVVGRDYHTEEQVVGYYNTGNRMKLWGKWGAFLGGMGVTVNRLRPGGYVDPLNRMFTALSVTAIAYPGEPDCIEVEVSLNFAQDFIANTAVAAQF